ncbi:MAG: hypothetical protein QM770_10160 [Tepidisphaeraceae bacterium]
MLCCLVDVQQGMNRTEIGSDRWNDMHLGACIAFIVGIFYMGRHHWLTVLRNAIGRGESSLYRTSFWTAVLGTVVMLAWLLVLGVHAWVAVLAVGFILAAHLVVTRVVAETGLPWYRTSMAASQIYTNFPASMMSTRDVYFGSVLTILGPLTTRDAIMTTASHGLGVTRSVGVEESQRRSVGWAVVMAIVVGLISAFCATLYCQYTWPTPTQRTDIPQRNNFGSIYIPQRDMVNPVKQFSTGQFAPKAYSPAIAVGTGAGVVTALEVASLRLSWWPLLPVGFVASHGAFIENAWFSIFIGWLAKVIIVRLGGLDLFTKARPAFVGIIFGESLAAGVWLIVNAVLVLRGFDSMPVKFLL